jgi:hypothetical protein
MELLKMKKEEFRQLCWLFRLFLIALDIENYQSEDFKIGEFKYALRLTAVEHTLHIELLKKNNPIVASLSSVDYFSQESLSFNFRTDNILNDYFELFFDGSKVIEENLNILYNIAYNICNPVDIMKGLVNNNGRKNKIYW